MAVAKKTAGKKAPAKKAAGKKAASKSAGAKKPANVQLVVGARIKDAARAQDVRVAGEFPEALNASVNELLSAAINRAKANGRSTLRPQDL